jgi:hypothetical protein
MEIHHEQSDPDLDAGVRGTAFCSARLELPHHTRLFIARQNRVMVVPADAAGSRRRGPVLRGSFAVMVIERDPSIH